VSRILDVMLHPGFIRYYEEAILTLAAAGHEVNLAFEISRDKLGEDVTAQRLAASSPNIRCDSAPQRLESVREFLARSDRAAVRTGEEPRARCGHEAWESLATTVRLLEDYVRFFGPEFCDAATIRGRAEKRLPRVYTDVLGVAARPAPARRIVRGLLQGIEAAIPTLPAIDAFLRECDPDLLLVTPLIELGSQQVDYVKSARKLGIRSALCVASWDNLTSKGLIRVLPDHVIVWNEAQATEAMTLHGVPSDRITVTGAQTFDRWFSMRPSRSREDFCRRVGLDPARPYLLYTGSSVFIAPEEVPFAERWLLALRESGMPRLAELGALFRPHPANSRQWHTFDSSSFPNAAIWPPVGTDPNSAGFKKISSTCLLQRRRRRHQHQRADRASIVGRPVFTVRSPEFAHGQRHLAFPASGGRAWRRPRSRIARRARAGRSRRHSMGRPQRAEQSSSWFVRPHGLDAPRRRSSRTRLKRCVARRTSSATT
jgi:hypothetical protein